MKGGGAAHGAGNPNKPEHEVSELPANTERLPLPLRAFLKRLQRGGARWASPGPLELKAPNVPVKGGSTRRVQSEEVFCLGEPRTAGAF